MKEQDLMCIKLHGVNRIGLKKIIDFIYTAKLSLNMENLQDTLEAASFLQILPVLDFCKVFLISGVRKRAHKQHYTVELQHELCWWHVRLLSEIAGSRNSKPPFHKSSVFLIKLICAFLNILDLNCWGSHARLLLMGKKWISRVILFLRSACCGVSREISF